MKLKEVDYRLKFVDYASTYHFYILFWAWTFNFRSVQAAGLTVILINQLFCQELDVRLFILLLTNSIYTKLNWSFGAVSSLTTQYS